MKVAVESAIVLARAFETSTQKMQGNTWTWTYCRWDGQTEGKKRGQTDRRKGGTDRQKEMREDGQTEGKKEGRTNRQKERRTKRLLRKPFSHEN